MRAQLLIACGMLGASVQLAAQEIVKVPASQAPTVARPDDLFKLPPNQWTVAKQLWAGPEPCTATAARQATRAATW